MTQVTEVVFVRHTEVAGQYQPLCYGSADVELSAAGVLHAKQIASDLALYPVDRIVHSGLQRTEVLAGSLAEFTGVTPEIQTGLQERNFGNWELSVWDQIYFEHGDEMLKMISDPNRYRPGGGETTREFVERVVSACRDLHQPGRTIVVTHGGVIAALSGLVERLEIPRWIERIPSHGESRVLGPVTEEHLAWFDSLEGGMAWGS